MWEILKAEFRYTRGALIVGYIIALLFLIFAIVSENYGLYNFMWNTAIVYLILMGILASATINEKRYRLYAMLPVTPHQIALMDGLYVLFVQLGMSLLWLIYLLATTGTVTRELLWLMLANNATILSLITIIGIHYHLGFF